MFDWIEDPLGADKLRAHIEDALGAGAVRPARILHLDDDPMVLAALARACHADEHVVSVSSVAEARAALAAENFDLAILDLDLGGAPAWTPAGPAQPRRKAVPVIIYSAHGASPEQAAQVQAALIKSHTSIDDLVRLLRVHIARSRRQSAEDVGGGMIVTEILVVEDEADVRKVVELALSRDPELTVRTCASGQRGAGRGRRAGRPT